MRSDTTVWMLMFSCLLGATQAALAEDNPEVLVVHEWGTFTELHDHAGVAVGGINTDDEPVPKFVHRISPYILQSTNESWRTRYPSFYAGKGLPPNPHATTRLETPVMYFYPPPGRKKPVFIDVDVQLRGGWLSEYYPNATVHAPGIRRHALNRHAVSTLQWHGLQLGADGEVPETNDHVWLAPRLPKSATVLTREGEAERYLFYRGVGNFSGPLRVTVDTAADRLRLTSRFHTLGLENEIRIPTAWLVHIRPDGSLAFRSLGTMTASPDVAEEIGNVKRGFGDEDFDVAHRGRLIADMHAQLVDDGLYDDEATAMLSTWNRAYFHTAGLRLFYVVPRGWTDDRVPLTLNASMPTEIERVMVGRIELITDRQQALIARIQSVEPESREWIENIPASQARDRFFAGDNTAAAELGVEVPPAYQAYLDLGRFRNALLKHELLQSRDPNLLAFATIHGLVPSQEAAKLTAANQ